MNDFVLNQNVTSNARNDDVETRDNSGSVVTALLAAEADSTNTRQSRNDESKEESLGRGCCRGRLVLVVT